MSIKLKEDVEKLKEANKKLRLENGAFVRENLRLKAEVDSRSPQKFGRFTVAALQSKIDQYERETCRLKKALERSDGYIDELESQVTQLKRATGGKISTDSVCEVSVLTEDQESEGHQDAPLLKNSEENIEETILTASQSPHHTESPPSVSIMKDNNLCSDSLCPESSNGYRSSVVKELFSDHQETLLNTPGTASNACLEKEWEDKIEDYIPCKDKGFCEVPSPDTPSMFLSSLCLDPTNHKSSPPDKPSTYLRKLFEDPHSEENMDGNMKEEHETCSSNAKKLTVKPVYWDNDQTNYDPDLHYDCSEQNSVTLQPGKSSTKSIDKAGQNIFKKLPAVSDLEGNRTRTSSEASMDAAYLDKISELDSMMSESESSKSPHSSKSADHDGVSKVTQCTKSKSKSEDMKDATKKTIVEYSHASDQLLVDEEWKPITLPSLSPCSVDMNEHFPFLIDDDSETNDIKISNSCFQNEKSSIFFFCNSKKIFKDPKSKPKPSFFNISAEELNLQNQLQSPWAAASILENGNRNNSHSTKRKMQSSLSSDSPLKSSKN